MDRKEAYRTALAAEIRSQKLYHALAVSFRRPETSTVFQQLVIMERNHEEKVRAAFVAEYPDADLDVEAEINTEIRHLNLKDPEVILEYAISREEAAQAGYLALAEGTRDAATKEMLLRFATEEDNHKTVLLAEMQRLQGAMQWFDPSELSGLMED